MGGMSTPPEIVRIKINPKMVSSCKKWEAQKAGLGVVLLREGNSRGVRKAPGFCLILILSIILVHCMH